MNSDVVLWAFKTKLWIPNCTLKRSHFQEISLGLQGFWQPGKAWRSKAVDFDFYSKKITLLKNFSWVSRTFTIRQGQIGLKLRILIYAHKTSDGSRNFCWVGRTLTIRQGHIGLKLWISTLYSEKIRWLKKFLLGWEDPDNQARPHRSKTVDFNVVLWKDQMV